MSMKNFINKVPSIILGRGEKYFENGNILNIEQLAKGIWNAQVEGNYNDYDIDIEIDNQGNVVDYNCDCPYDGGICKHVAAVALSIQEQETKPTQANKTQKQLNWRQLIENATLDELRKFALNYGMGNNSFRQHVKLSLSQPTESNLEDKLFYYRKLIKEIYRNFSDRGFLDYQQGNRAMREISIFEINIGNQIEKNNFTEAFTIAAALAMETIEVIQNMDDSSGMAGGVIDSAFESIEELFSKKIDSQLSNQIFDWLLEQMKNSDYDDYGVGDVLETLFFNTVIQLDKISIGHQFLDEKIKQVDQKDTWSRNHQLQTYINKKIDLLQSENKLSEIEKIQDNHLYLVDIRSVRIEKAIKEQNYTTAENLILDGIKISEKENNPNVTYNWKNKLIEVYKKLKNEQKLSKLYREVYIENSSNIEYFNSYKLTIPKENWLHERDKLILELKGKKNQYSRSTFQDDLAKIYIHEKMCSNLFQLVKSSPHLNVLNNYSKHLKTTYSQELISFYEKEIHSQAKQTGRNIYENLIPHFETMAKLEGGLEAAKNLMNALLVKYPKRSAMLDVFSKIRW